MKTQRRSETRLNKEDDCGKAADIQGDRGRRSYVHTFLSCPQPLSPVIRTFLPSWYWEGIFHMGVACPAFQKKRDPEHPSCTCFFHMPLAQNNAMPKWHIWGIHLLPPFQGVCERRWPQSQLYGSQMELSVWGEGVCLETESFSVAQLHGCLVS